MIVVDASVLIAFLDDQDAHHAEAREVIALRDSFGVHYLTLAETLVHGVGQGRLDAMAATIEAVGIVEVDRLPGEPVTLARLRVETGLKLPDCCVVAVAEARAARLATFDQRLSAVARRRGIEVLGAGG